MASSIALKRLTSSSNHHLLNKFFNIPIRSISVSSPQLSSFTTRSFNTNTQMSKFEEEDDNRGIDIDRRSDQGISRRNRDFFSDVFDPFSPTRSLSQVFNMMDQLMDNPFLSSGGSRIGGIGSGLRRGWDVKEDENALYFKVDMPGLGKEDVKVSVEQNTLIIKGEGERESEDEESSSSRRRYSSRIDLPPNLYKTDQIKAEMKNGVLKVLVPKVKEEERKDVFQVNVA